MSMKQSPHLLSPINEDSTIQGLHPAWSVGIASNTLVPEYALVYVRSNRWPGMFLISNNAYDWFDSNTRKNKLSTAKNFHFFQ